jgi:predicted TIM-barrel fold metal-dependent hydrolase
MEYVGYDKFFWASDFPHDDHTRDYMGALAQLVAPLSADAQRGLLGDNVARVYGL